MAACESPLPENPDLSPWTKKKMNPNTPSSSFGDIFRDPPPPLFHHPPPPEPLVQPSSFWSSVSSLPVENESRGESSSFFQSTAAAKSHKKSESLQLCTEGLGFESFDDVEDNLSTSGQEAAETWSSSKQIYTPRRRELLGRRASSAGGGGGYPPPIPSISLSGKPWVCFKSYRQDGRFVLKEERIPTQEVLHASREDGRLRLHFVHRPEEEEEEEEETETDNKEEEDEEIGVDEDDDS